MAYATVDDLQSRMVYAMSANERAIADTLLSDASNKLDMEFARCRKSAPDDADGIVALERICCALVARVLSTSNQTEEQFYSNDVTQFVQQSSFYDGNGILRLNAEERRELMLPSKSSFAAIGSL